MEHDDAEAQAVLVRELLHLIRALLSGGAPREQAEEWAGVNHAAFGSHAVARSALGMLGVASERRGGEYLLRRHDLEALERDLIRGQGLCVTQDELLGIRRTMAQLSGYTWAESDRAWMDGLGVYEAMQFTSFGTGHTYAAIRMLEGREPRLVQIRGPRDVDPVWLAEDLIRHLRLKSEEVVYLDASIDRAALESAFSWVDGE